MEVTERIIGPNPLEEIRIVLVEPQGPRNIGAVCRAMKNFGLSRLILVRPGCELDLEATKMALSAQNVLDKTQIVESIPEAVAGCGLVLGTANRRGQYHEPHTPIAKGLERIGKVLGAAPISILFGREEWGLTKDDLKYCQGTIHVLTDPAFSSMNLSQAVLLVAYELYKAFGNKPEWVNPHADDPFEQPPSFEELQRLFAHMESVLSKCEFLPSGNPDALFQVIRTFISRSDAKRREINVLMGIFSNVEGFMKKYVGYKAYDKSGVEKNKPK